MRDSDMECDDVDQVPDIGAGEALDYLDDLMAGARKVAAAAGLEPELSREIDAVRSQICTTRRAQAKRH